MIKNTRVWLAIALAGLFLIVLILGIGIYLYYVTPVSSTVGRHNSATIVPANSAVHNTVHTPAGPANRQFQVGAHPLLTIKGHECDVNIHAGHAGIINVIVHKRSTNLAPDPNAIHVLYDQSTDTQGRNHITVSTDPAYKDIDYDVTVPAATQVNIEVNAGSVAASGIAGIAIDTGSGSLELENIHGPLDVHTESGDITVQHIVGTMFMEASSGSIRANDIRGSLKAITRSGDVVAGDAVLNGQSILKTNSGSVSFTGSLDVKGSYQLETYSGDIDLTLPENAAFALNANIDSGSINNEFGGNQVGHTPRAQIMVSIRSGSVNVNKDS